METTLVHSNGHAVAQAPALDDKIITSLILNGDLHDLNPQQKVAYYQAFCERLGLDPATQPFKILTLNGKETLYADKGAAAQLVRKHGLTQTVTAQETVAGVFCVIVRTSDKSGRHSDSLGAVPIQGLYGDNLSNALMKAHTKAKRRGVLEFMGLGSLDESEIVTIPGARAQTIAGEPVPMPMIEAPASGPNKVSAPPTQPGQSGLAVTEVRTLKTGTSAKGRPWTLTLVKFSNGVEATTFDNDGWIVAKAQELYSSGAACAIDTAPNKSGKGLELLFIGEDTSAPGNGAQDAEFTPDDDLPF